LASEANTLSS